MNKFTRSQMGKIMACALSAAMAVTVVPTYMKPMTAYAAFATDVNEYTNGQALKATPKNAGNDEDTFVIGLFKKTDTTNGLKKSDAVYLFEGISDGTNVTGYIPYSVASGSYYVGVSQIAGAMETLLDNTAFEMDEELTKINPATAANAIELTSTDDNIYYLENSGTVTSNTEVLTTTVNGKYEKLQYTFTVKDKEGNAIDVSDAFDITMNAPTSGVPTTYTYPTLDTTNAKCYTLSDELENSVVLPTFDIKQKAKEDGATLEVEVAMKVTGRTKTYNRSYVFTSKETLTELTNIGLSSDSAVALVGETVTIKTTPAPATSNENIEYSFDTTTVTATMYDVTNISSLTETISGDVHSLYAEDSSNNKIALLATFNEKTGELVASQSGTYAIKATSQAQTATPVTKTIKVDMLSLSTDTLGLNAGLTNEAINTPFVATVGSAANTVKEIALDNYYVTYSVEDTDIIEIINQTNSLAQTLKVNTKSAGVTKINADIIVYDTNGRTYNFTKSTYVVVAPKTTDKDFVLTDVPNTEVYVNALAETNVFSDALKLQAADAIIDGELDAKVLTYKAYSQINQKAVNKYTNHYDYTNTNETSYNTVVTGMLFAAADPDFCKLSTNDFDESVSVEYKVSELYGKDYVYKMEGSVINFVAEMLVDNKVEELKQPVWITVTDAAKLKTNSVYTVYDDGEPIYVVKADANNAITFQTDSFSVFSIVETPGATETDNTVTLPSADKETSDIYDMVNFVAHVQRRIGTDDKADIEQTLTEDGIISIGTHGQSRRIEKITLTGIDADQVEMTAHVQKRVDHPEDIADLTQVVNEDGSISIGTEHQSRRIEAFSMNLKGDLAEQYDVYYRVHAQNYGWLGWAKNGEVAGTSGHSFRLEGIEIIFVEKDAEFDETQYQKTAEEGDRGYSAKPAYMDRVSK